MLPAPGEFHARIIDIAARVSLLWLRFRRASRETGDEGRLQRAEAATLSFRKASLYS